MKIMRYALLLCSTAAIAFGGPSSGQMPEAALQQKLSGEVHDYSISASNLLEALARVSDDFQLRMGIEWQEPSVGERPVSRRYERVTALQVVQDIVGADPRYKVTAANGVLHVSIDEISRDSRNFLNLRIDDFAASSEYAFHANNRLHRVVVALASGFRPTKDSGCAGSFGVGAGDRLTSFHLRNTTVRDILDAIVTSAGFNIWMVTFPQAKPTTQGGFFEATSIFSPSLPKTELPTWDLLIPGYDPARKGFGPGWPRGEWRPVSPGTTQ